MRFLLKALFIFISAQTFAQVYLPRFDVQGHRGCRGLKPENSIPAFLAALDSGVTTLELDVVVTKDKQLLVSHEPFMSQKICLDPSGNEISGKDSVKYNIYNMTSQEVSQWDCGSKINVKFPQQEKIKVSKPLLRDVILAVENHIKNYTRYEVDYNIEIKSLPMRDGIWCPKPDEYSDMVYRLLDQYLPLDRIVIQSFDFRVLKYWHSKYPEVRLSALVENHKSPDWNLKALGFNPSIYSPKHTLLSNEDVDRCHKLKIRVIPWDVNEEKDMVGLKGMGVDGFITDYPDRASKYKMTLSIIRK